MSKSEDPHLIKSEIPLVFLSSDLPTWCLIDIERLCKAKSTKQVGKL